MIGIYRITNPKGRVYIGQAVCIVKRKKSYEKLKCKGQPRLYASLIKYGFAEHIFEIVEECTIEELNTRERYWQECYNVLSKNGLNCKLTKTSDRSGKMSEQAVEKMRSAKLGKRQSPEHVASRIKDQKGKRLGPRPAEVRAKISSTKTGIKLGPYSEERRAALRGERGPQKNPQQKVVCVHCKKEGGANGMKRFHFDNCKNKKQ